MREIKFRQWLKTSVHYWGFMNEGYFVGPVTNNQPNPIHEQFTGLHDCNGVEIYEGDVVKWGHVDGYIEQSGARVAVVDMSSPSEGLVFDALKPIEHRFEIGCFMYAECTDKCMEVIGNIHQNPELLK